MRRVHAWYYYWTAPFRKSIRNKLLFTMISLSVLPVIIVTIMATDNNRVSIENEVIQSNLSNIRWTGQYMDEKLTELNALVYTVFISSSLNNYLTALNQNEPDTSSRMYTLQKNVIDTLSSVYYTSNTNVYNITLYTLSNSKQFSYNSMQTSIRTLSPIPTVYNQMIQQDKDYSLHNASSDSGTPLFELTRSLNDFDTHRRLGFLTLQVDWKIADSMVELLNSDQASRILITDESDNILFQPLSEAAPLQSFDDQGQIQEGSGYFQTKDAYVFYATLDTWNLRLIKIIPRSLINESAERTLNYGLIVAVISVILSSLIAIMVAWRTATPIVKLARSIQNLSFIRDSKRPTKYRNDEIGLLELKMYHMSNRINEHIQTEYGLNLEKKTAQLRALQAQINPHFLQNTLQLIGGMAFSETPEKLYAVIKALSEMFRYVIREPDEAVELQKEFQHLRNYLFIQEQRYQNRITTDLTIEPGLEHQRILKLILQPMAENTFQHGFGTRSSHWKLNVHAVRREDRLVIIVQDNGQGMSADQLDSLNQRLLHPPDSDNSDGHIGLSNVAARIQLKYGKQYGVQVSSLQDFGTTITISLPLSENGYA